MKRMLLGVGLALVSLVTPVWAETAAPAGVSGEKLLDQVISRPGSYSQVCDMISMPADIPYRAYDLTGFAGASFSKANVAAIEQNRAPLTEAIRARLLAIDLKRKAVDPAKDPKPEESMDGEDVGCDPKSPNPLLLDLIVSLKAIGTLPELLVLEDRLVKAIAAAKDDAKVAPPVVTGWVVGMEGPYDESADEAKRDRKINLFQARVAQRDLVVLMGVLMRGEAYGPFLKSSIEKAYVKGLKAKMKEGVLANYKVGEPVPAGLEESDISIDPVTKLPRMAWSPVLVPYTRESRDEVRTAAALWISEHP